MRQESAAASAAQEEARAAALAEAQGELLAFAAGAASAEAARAAQFWLPYLLGLPQLLEAMATCIAGSHRSFRRCAKLYDPRSKLSAGARWNFEYVRSMCADPRDVSLYVWGF